MSQPQKRRRAILIAFTLILIGAVLAYQSYHQRPQAFIQQWSERFRAVDSLESAKQLASTEPVIVRTFPSGEWLIATCEYSCCDGAGFDATVMRDSSGAIFTNLGHNFCGVEGLGEELSEFRVPATDLSSFYSTLTDLPLQRR
jgi:hypothetical protein